MGCGSSTRVETLPMNFGRQEQCTSQIAQKGNSSNAIIPPQRDLIPGVSTIAAVDKHALAEQCTSQEEQKGNSSNAIVPPQRDLIPGATTITAIDKQYLEEQCTSQVAQKRNSSNAIVPPQLKKRDLIPDASMFAAIDKHALEAPNRLRTSPEVLVEYLIQPARNDLERIRAFYRWITNNISYDVESFFGGIRKPSTAQSVLQSGKAVCQGYGDLFYEFCRLARIPCHVVSGFAKGYSYNPEIPYTESSETNHAWNIVMVNGEWRPVECTWGAGSLTESRQFQKAYSEVYFLTDPEQFIYAHFPFMNGDGLASCEFQLLKHPISLNEYNRTVKPNKYCLEWRVELLSHKQQLLSVSEEVDIILQGKNPQLLDVLCKFNDRVSKRDYHNFAMVTRMINGKFSVRIRPPTAGKYDVHIFGKINDNENTYQSVIQYILVSSTGSSSSCPYPEHRGAWGAKPVAAEYGFNRNIFSHSAFTTSSGELELNLAITDHTPVSCRLEFAEQGESLDRYVQVTRPLHYVNIKVRLNRCGFYAVRLFAGKPESTSHQYVGAFLIDNTNSVLHHSPFPYYWPSAHENHCIILQPENGDIASNEKTLLRCIAPSVKRLMVDGVVYTNRERDIFEIFMEPRSEGEFIIYGSTEEIGSLSALFTFKVV